jgi:glycosyltransferase involved in cell wall biosynthesis
MKIVVVCGMSDQKVRARLKPLIEIDEIERIYLIRRKSIQISKVVTVSPPAFLKKVIFLAEIYRIISLLIIIITQKPKLIYSIYFVPHGIYAAIFGALFNLRVVHELIGTDRPKLVRSRLFQNLIKRAEMIGVRGQESMTQLSELGIAQEKIFVSIAVNILDFDHFKPNPAKKVYDLIYCGRMDQNKQLDIIVKSIAVVKEKMPKIKALFIGDGPTKEILEELANHLGLNKSIRFLGYKEYEEIPSYLNMAKIFIMSSAFEGLPMAMLEAIGCGLPVIVPGVGDIEEIAKHNENALIVQQPSVEGYSTAIKALLKDDQYYEKLRKGAYETRVMMKQVYTLKRAKMVWRSILFVET